VFIVDISLSTPSRHFWIHPRIVPYHFQNAEAQNIGKCNFTIKDRARGHMKSNIMSQKFPIGIKWKRKIIVE